MNFQMFKLNLEKAGEPEVKLPTCVGSSESKRVPKKKIYFRFIDYAKAFVQITTNCGKFFKRWEYKTTSLPPEKSVCRLRGNS